MSDALSFWLDNKVASARKVAELGDQVLVDYRGRFYVIKDGAALMKGSKPLHYSKSSMPAVWKKAMRGEVPALQPAAGDDGPLPVASVTKRVRIKKEMEEPAMPESRAVAVETVPAPKAAEPKPAGKPLRKIEQKPVSQSTVTAGCPYCNQKHELPLEKGKSGKPFFVTCTKCATDFAVRFVPVTMFQAQVAAFR